MNDQTPELQFLTKERLKHLWKDEVFFYKFVTDRNALGYQANFLRDQHTRLAFCSGRRVGKTEVAAVKVLHRAVTYPQQEILIIAPTQRQASILFNRIANFVNSNPFINTLVKNQTQTMLFFRNGSAIYALPAGRTGFTIRGYSPHMVVIDEAAFVPEQVFTSIILSLASIGTRYLIYTSTPFGERGRFYLACEDPESPFHKYYVSAEDSPIVSEEFLKEQKSILTEAEYKQDVLGQFVPESDVWITKDLFLSCVSHMEFTERRSDRYYFLGVDVARFGTDETVFIVGEVTEEGELTVVHIESTSTKPLTDTVGRIVRLHKEWNFSSIYVDETGLGGGAVDMAVEQDAPIEAITFTLRDIAEMYNHMKWCFEKRMIKVPMSKKLMHQVTNVLYGYTSTGIWKHIKEEKIHDDYADALALLCLSIIKHHKDSIIYLKGEKK
uniref:Putative terminase n=1 Tax=viral metagenome TaxID=1070528 RepID=A0A6M3XXU2_9ZZZZ